jgi:malonyl-CoA/methylmalonyl-CoA synthetase
MGIMAKSWSSHLGCSLSKRHHFRCRPSVGLLIAKQPSYIGDDHITNKAFDEDGFYKTGDMGRLVGDQYFFAGRASTDCESSLTSKATLPNLYVGIRFKHFKISIIELEQHLMKLPYVSEAHVLSVLDYECQGLAAALIRLTNSRERQDNIADIDLRKVREDLSLTLELYKLPAFLRILTDEDEVPYTASGKPLKSQMLERYFQISGYCPRNYVVPGVEFWGSRGDLSVERRAWDWEGEE